MKRAVLLVVVALAAFPIAPADGSWSKPVTIFGKADGQSWLGTLSDGSVIAAANDIHRGPIQAAVRPPGGVFGDPVAISPPRSYGSDMQGRIVTGPNGRALFMHSSNAGAKLALRDPDGSWRSVDFSDDVCCPGMPAFGPEGNLTIAGMSYDGTNWLGAATYDQNGALVARHSIGPSGYDAHVGATIVAPDGTTLVEWYGGPLDGHVYLSTAAPGQGFGPPETIASGMHGESDVLLGRAQDGTLISVFAGASRYVDGNNGVLYTRVRLPDGTWQRAEQIPGDPITNLQLMGLAMNRAGDAVLSWIGSTGVDQRLVMSYRAAGGRWEPATVGPPHSGSIPRLAIGRDGAAIAADTCYAQCDPTVFVSYDHLNGGGFAPPENIAPVPTGSDSTVGIRLAVDAVGDAVAVWNSTDHGVFSKVHHVGKATGGGTPSVNNFEVRAGAPARSALHAASKRPRLFSYRLSRRARVVIRIERLAKGGKRVGVAKLAAALHGGSNVSPIPPDVAYRLRAGRRYRATIVAIGRSGRRSKPHSVTFRR